MLVQRGVHLFEWCAGAGWGFLSQEIPMASGPLLTQCTTCKKHIYWVVTENGKKMPVDHPSTPDGNIIFINRLAHVLHKGEVVPDGVKRWTSHHATCPQGDSHRKGKSAKEPQLYVQINLETLPGLYFKMVKFSASEEMQIKTGMPVQLISAGISWTGTVEEIVPEPEYHQQIITVIFGSSSS